MITRAPLSDCRCRTRAVTLPGVKPLTESEIRAAFVNCTKGEAKRLNVPRDLAEQPWEDLDFLGWRDRSRPSGPTWSRSLPVA